MSQAQAGPISDHPCFTQISKLLRTHGIMEGTSFKKQYSRAEEYVSGRSEFDVFDGLTAARLGYAKRLDGSAGASLTLVRRDLVGDEQKLTLIYQPNCQVDQVSYGNKVLTKAQCDDLRSLTADASDFSSKVSTLLKEPNSQSITCEIATQIQKACKLFLTSSESAKPQTESTKAVK